MNHTIDIDELIARARAGLAVAEHHDVVASLVRGGVPAAVARFVTVAAELLAKDWDSTAT